MTAWKVCTNERDPKEDDQRHSGPGNILTNAESGASKCCPCKGVFVRILLIGALSTMGCTELYADLSASHGVVTNMRTVKHLYIYIS